MKRPQELEVDLKGITTMVDITTIFEGIASLKIAKIKNEVLQSQAYFKRLWSIYTQIRVDAAFHFGRRTSKQKVINKELFIVITAEGGFSGDIDEKLISWMLGKYDPKQHDIVVIGHHGAIQLSQRGIAIKKYYKLPAKDEDINVTAIISEVQKYKTSTAYYQTYVSLMVQDVKRISLQTAVQEQGRSLGDEKNVITEENYIFEPSTYAVVDHLERTMLTIMLSQIILESKLAQYASRFRAMSAASDKAKESQDETRLTYNRSKRALNDERLKEVISGLRKIRAEGAV